MYRIVYRYYWCCLLFQNDSCVFIYIGLMRSLTHDNIDHLMNWDKPVYRIVRSWELKHQRKMLGNHRQKGSKGNLLQVFCMQPSEWERWIPSNGTEVGIEQKRLRSQTNPVLLSCQFLYYYFFKCFDCFDFRCFKKNCPWAKGVTNNCPSQNWVSGSQMWTRTLEPYFHEDRTREKENTNKDKQPTAPEGEPTSNQTDTSHT